MKTRSDQRGMALVSALLLLLVLTILSVGMFHSFGLQERIAGNTREKERANHAAETAQNYAEWWLTANGGINATTGSACTAATTTPVVCSNALTTPTTLPWNGVNYAPPSMTIAAAGTLGAYAQSPQFYISFLSSNYNSTAGTQTSVYQIDANATGGNTSSTSIVESTYIVSVTYTARGDNTKYIKLDGP